LRFLPLNSRSCRTRRQGAHPCFIDLHWKHKHGRRGRRTRRHKTLLRIAAFSLEQLLLFL
jgi:hypothetical protein